MTENLKQKTNVVAETKEVDNERAMNIGVPVKLKFGEYRVRELNIFELTVVLADGFEVFMNFAETEDNTDLGFLKEIVRKPEFKEQVTNIFALYCGTENRKPFEEIGLADFSKLLAAVKRVTDFEEIKTAFLELGLQKYLPTLIPNSKEQQDEKPTA